MRDDRNNQAERASKEKPDLSDPQYAFLPDKVELDGASYTLKGVPEAYEDPEEGTCYRADAVREDGRAAILIWHTSPAYDAALLRVETERRFVDLCEYVPEEELYKKAGASAFYGTIRNHCIWDMPYKAELV